MRPFFLAALVCLFALFHTTAADTTDTFRFSNAIDGATNTDTAKLWFKAGDPAIAADPPRPKKTPEEIYYDAQCSGHSLMKAMNLDEDICKETFGWKYSQSKCKGLPNELPDWGYHVSDADDANNCKNLIRGLTDNGIRPAFAELEWILGRRNMKVQLNVSM